MTRAARLGLVMLGLAGAAAAVFARAPIAQDPAYHRMADGRTILGVPNALNVASNLPFAVVGILGLAVVLGRADAARWEYVAVFCGTLLTAFGSAYYHLAPDDARLVWDRLPMAVAFMGLVAAVLAERVAVRVGHFVLLPLLAAGVGSVAYWHWTEQAGAGDLRPYVLVQFGSLLAIVLLVGLFPGPPGATRHLAFGLLAYVLAKSLEAADRVLWDLGHVVSGHTLKHLAAALGIAAIAAMLARRDRPPTGQLPVV